MPTSVLRQCDKRTKSRTENPTKMKFLKSNIIKLAIATVFILILAGASLSYYNNLVMSRSLLIKYQSELTLKAVDRIFENIQLMDISARGYALIREPQYLFHTPVMANDYNATTFKTLDSLFKIQQYPGSEKYAQVQQGLNEYTGLFSRMVGLLNQKQDAAYLQLLARDEGKSFWRSYIPFLDEVRKFETDLNDVAQIEYQAAVDRNKILQSLLLVLGLPTLIWILIKLHSDEKNRKALLLNLHDNNLKYLFNDGATINSTAEKLILDNSIQCLKNAAQFVDNIASGNYDVTWQGLTKTNELANKDNLAGKLISMRDQMKVVREADQRRLWASDGLSKFSDIVRNNQSDINALNASVLSFLVKYLNCQQGSIFMPDENDHLDLAACYAFDKKKFIQKKIPIGHGLIGQAYLEATSTILTNIPKGYIQITSGLGDATPECLAIVPFKQNGQVMAIIELATFDIFTADKIQFLEKAGEVVASALMLACNSEKSKIFLKQLQEQTQQLRSQEEELKQNLEEMEAIQEEMRRKELYQTKY